MERIKLSLSQDRSRVMHIISIAPDGYIVEIREPNRTLEQNALYWSTIHEIADTIKIDGKQYLPQVWHKYFKERFLPSRIIELPYGHIAESEPSTTDLTKEEFSEFVESVIQFYNENKEQP